ncbi:MAG: alkyl hydroperoxide reductase subunit F, partial [Acidimicrobiales bacterium]
ASRKQLKTLFITKEWGGQSIVSPDIQNWIGTPSIPGAELAKNMEDHLRTYAGDFVAIEEKEVATVVKSDEGFITTFKDGSETQGKTVLIATGSKRRQLAVEGADKFEHKGLTYCATCDGPLFAGQDVAVIGGGNAGFETAAQLLAYAKSVTLIHRGDQYRADPVTVEKVLSHENMTGVLSAKMESVEGDQFLSGITYTDADGTQQKKEVTGVFVEIGMVPATDFVADAVERDDYSRIVIDPWTQQTSTPGIWAAGDCTNIKYHQNNISAGDAVRALEDIYVTLKTK